MKASMHNGRGGSAIHNDRSFMEMEKYRDDGHIDHERLELNSMWSINPNMIFKESELKYYEEHFSEALKEVNDGYIRNYHPDRCKTMEDWLDSPRTKPEESILQIGKKGEKVNGLDLSECAAEFIHWVEKRTEGHCKVLDYSLHMDEATPHVHFRRVWQYEDKGVLKIGQEKSLELLGIERPNPSEPKDRYNNRKMTFDAEARQKWYDIVEAHGYEIDRTPIEGRKHKSTNDYILGEQARKIEENKKVIEETTSEKMELFTDKLKLLREKRSVSEEVDSLKSELDEKAEELSKAKAELSSKSFEVSFLTRKADRLTDTIQEMSQSAERVSNELTQVQNALDQANSELTQTEHEVYQLEEEARHLKLEKNDIRIEINSLKAEKRELNEEVSAIREKLADGQERIQKQKAAYENNQGVLQKQAEKIDKNNTLIQSLESKIDNLRGSLNSYIEKAKDILQDFWLGKNRASVLEKLEDYKGAVAEIDKAHDKAIGRADKELVKDISEPTKEIVEEATEVFRRRGRGR